MLLHKLGYGGLAARTLPSLGLRNRRLRLRRLLGAVIYRCCDRSLRLRLLLHCRIHLLLDILLMELDVIQNALLECPAEEVQLAYRGQESLMLRHLEEDPLPPAKRVKELLAIRLELVLVVHIHGKLLAVQDVRGVVCLAVVRNKPVNEPQAHFTGSLEQFYDLIDILALTVKTLEA